MSSTPVQIQRVAALLGKRPVSWNAQTESNSPVLRFVVTFDDGPSVFVKAANNPRTAQWLRSEYHMYRALEADFLPHLLGWYEDAMRPMLILEDLSSATWPPPWKLEHVQQVLEALSRLRQSRISMDRTILQTRRVDWRCWSQVRANPEPFLSLGLCSRGWLEKALPPLQKREAMARLDGNEILHGDVKSGNVCFVGGRAILLDWNWACRGNGQIDIAMWAPSLAAEGGPPPEDLLPSQAPLAAVVAGNLALRAPKPVPPLYQQLRSIQLQNLRQALGWACRASSIPLPDLV